jgi:hypothetical protein
MAEPGNSKIVVPEPGTGQLGGHFSPAARDRIDVFLKSFISFEPTLALLYSNTGGRGPGSWSMQAVSSDIVDELAHLYSGFGTVVCYELDGIRVLVPQLAHIEELDKGMLEFSGDRLIAGCMEPG